MKAPAAARAGARQLGRDSVTAGRHSSPHLRQPPSVLTSKEPCVHNRLTLRVSLAGKRNIDLLIEDCGHQEEKEEVLERWRKHGSVDISVISVQDCAVTGETDS